MRRPAFRFIVPIAALLIIPFVYNSCQGGLSHGFSSSQAATSSCKVGLAKGVVTKMEAHDDRPPGPFAAGKVMLRADLEPGSGGALGKASAPLTLASGTSLSVLLDNGCLQANRDALDDTVISRAAIDSGELLPRLDRQAYNWVLDRTYTDEEIQTIADHEACVVGVSWNKTYKIQTTSFNDGNYPLQTHLPAIHAADAYDYFYNSTGGMATTGNPPVLIAVVDTGVDWKHPDLAGNMWAHTQGIGIDITTLNTSLVDYNPFDVSDEGHGTHVSGLIAAVANNGTGTIGAMPYRAQIMGIKVFSRDATTGELSTTSQYFYNAMKFAYLNGAQVVNLSLGAVSAGAATDSMALAGVTEAVNHGVFVVTVIGNANSGNGVNIDGVNNSSIPGQFSTTAGVIGVGSFDASTGNKSFFSNYSTTYAEIGAPGAESGTTGLVSTIPTAIGSYGRLAGTSQAAPLVSAAAGLTIGLIRNAYGVSPTPAEVERLLTASAVKSSQLTSYFKDGNRLDLLSLVQKINADYPLTATGGTVVLPSTCP